MLPRETLAARFPHALGAIVAGSTARGEDTATSDVDLVVFLTGRPAPMRRTERHDGRLVEFFVHTEESLLAFLDHEQQLRRSPLLHMVGSGVIDSDSDGRIAALQDLARRRWDAGPDTLGPAELEDRRYRLTALLDDLADEPDPGERSAIATAVFTDVADLALISRGAWSGTGRWLVRRLRHVDQDLCRRLLSGLHSAVHGEPHRLLSVSRAELDRLGGPLDDGYERRA